MVNTIVNAAANVGKTIDYNEANVLISRDSDVIVLTTMDINTDSFEAVVLWEHESGSRVGELADDWVKRDFVLFKGDITLKNI